VKWALVHDKRDISCSIMDPSNSSGYHISFLKLNNNLARSVLGSRLSVGATKNTTATDDSTSLVAVGLTKSQAGRSGGGGTNNKFFLSRKIRVR
jgi:hypothetical protein